MKCWGEHRINQSNAFLTVLVIHFSIFSIPLERIKTDLDVVGSIRWEQSFITRTPNTSTNEGVRGIEM